MKKKWWTPFVALALAAPIACSESNDDSKGDDDTQVKEQDDGGDAAVSNATDASAADAGGGGAIGQLRDKGVKTVNPSDVSSQSSWTCAAVCAEAGGVCDDEGGRGAGYSYGRYTDGSGTFNSRVSSCMESVSSSSTWRLTELDCYCGEMDVPPSVRVKRSEGYHSCNDVCESWDLTCDAERQSLAYSDEAESSSSKIKCGDKPEDGTHHYLCECK